MELINKNDEKMYLDYLNNIGVKDKNTIAGIKLLVGLAYQQGYEDGCDEYSDADKIFEVGYSEGFEDGYEDGLDHAYSSEDTGEPEEMFGIGLIEPECESCPFFCSHCNRCVLEEEDE